MNTTIQWKILPEICFADARYKRDVVTGGINYYLNSQVALKADYSHRRIAMGDYNSEKYYRVSSCLHRLVYSKIKKT